MASIARAAGLKPVSAVVIVVGALGTWTPTTAAGQTAGDTAGIRARTETYLDVWGDHDAAGLGALFTEEADVVMGNQPAARGRQEIQDLWQAYFERQEPERRLRLDTGPLRFLAPDAAIISVTTTTGGRDSEGRDLPARRFRGTWLWERQGDEWLISAMRGLPLEEDRVDLIASLETAEALRPDIRGFAAAYEDALNTHDAGTVSAFYTDDAELIVRDSPVISGRAAIRAWWRAYFGEPRPYRALLIIDEIRMIAPDVALVNITATGAFTQQAADQLTPVRYARATWVLTREAGEWRIAELLVLPGEDDRIIRSGGPSN
jgi:uncharacterized protein (TIGR02246 family)